MPLSLSLSLCLSLSLDSALAPTSSRYLRYKRAIDYLEKVTGFDIDGDGTVGGIVPIAVDEMRKEAGAPLGVFLKDIGAAQPRVRYLSADATSAAKPPCIPPALTHALCSLPPAVR